MKIVKKANGDRVLKITKSEWRKIGKQQGWMKKAGNASREGDYIVHYFSLRDPNQGEWEREEMEDLLSREPGALVFDRSGPGEGFTEYRRLMEGEEPDIVNVPTGMGAVFIPVKVEGQIDQGDPFATREPDHWSNPNAPGTM